MRSEERKTLVQHMRRIDAFVGWAAFGVAMCLYLAVLTLVVYALSRVVELFWAILMAVGAAIWALPLLHHGFQSIAYLISLYFAPVEIRVYEVMAILYRHVDPPIGMRWHFRPSRVLPRLQSLREQPEGSLLRTAYDLIIACTDTRKDIFDSEKCKVRSKEISRWLDRHWEYFYEGEPFEG